VSLQSACVSRLRHHLILLQRFVGSKPVVKSKHSMSNRFMARSTPVTCSARVVHQEEAEAPRRCMNFPVLKSVRATNRHIDVRQTIRYDSDQARTEVKNARGGYEIYMIYI
jgi:hypothetical protein